MSANTITLTVNGNTWTDDDRRSARPCAGCGDLTQGRIERKPYCRPCGMTILLRSLRIVRNLAREVQL